ncbi:MAG: hypothetical protein K2R93_05915 [Gemmatimonadaceae bacterium]|nr:hypothetical protein [Gemmatimonadaceae bacterium]
MTRLRYLGAAVVVWSACTVAPAEHPVAVPVVQIVGHDFAFEAPDSLPPGPTRFAFRSDGTVPHEVAIARVKRGVSLDSVLRVEIAGGDIDGLYDPGEGLLYTAVGETVTAELQVTLEAGRDYVLACTLEKDCKAHSMLGMVRGVRVY